MRRFVKSMASSKAEKGEKLKVLAVLYKAGEAAQNPRLLGEPDCCITGMPTWHAGIWARKTQATRSRDIALGYNGHRMHDGMATHVRDADLGSCVPFGAESP